MRELAANGTEIFAWGTNDKHTPERAQYDFVAVFKFTNEESALSYERIFRRAGWYDYFEQVNVMANVQSYEPVLEMLCDL